MDEVKPRSVGATIMGGLTLVAGLAAFLVPLQHAGPYGIPGRGLVGGLLCFAIAGVLLVRGAPKPARVAAWVASPVVLFFALYGALAELEEVVVLYAGDAELRLWIVDHEGTEWVSMQGSKADAHGLDGAKLEMLRAGSTRCVDPALRRCRSEATHVRPAPGEVRDPTPGWRARHVRRQSAPGRGHAAPRPLRVGRHPGRRATGSDGSTRCPRRAWLVVRWARAHWAVDRHHRGAGRQPVADGPLPGKSRTLLG